MIQYKVAIRAGGEGLLLLAMALGMMTSARAQQTASPPASAPPAAPSARGETTQDFNLKLEQRVGRKGDAARNAGTRDYRIGAEDLLDISVLEAPDLSRTVRVSDDGAISLPLIGTVQAAGLTSLGLEAVLENLLERTYMKDPHVSVFVKEMRSHPVSVFGAVEKPGVYQIRDAKTLIEVLSMAEGLAPDAGDTVIVMRHAGFPAQPSPASFTPAADRRAGPNESQLDGGSAAGAPTDAFADGAGSGPESLTIGLKDLLTSSNPRYNVLVYPGDVVKVTRAGIVYVVGEVHKPGGFLLKTNENISVLQALALAEGLTSTAKARNARLIVPDANGTRKEIPLDLDRILKGKSPDPLLNARDILFVPSSSRKAAFHAVYRSAEGIAAAVSGAAVYRW